MTRLFKTLLLTLLRGYKAMLSPFLPPGCRYVPTCSDYAAEAIERYGAFWGSAMAVWRLLRCHPFVRGGYDPVPWNEVGNDPDSNGASLQRTAGDGCPHVIR